MSSGKSSEFICNLYVASNSLLIASHYSEVLVFLELTSKKKHICSNIPTDTSTDRCLELGPSIWRHVGFQIDSSSTRVLGSQNGGMAYKNGILFSQADI